jgi:glutamate dehydrogenase/leucine dehydrogenase
MKSVHSSSYRTAEECGQKDNLVAEANIAAFAKAADAMLDQGQV